MCQEYYFLLASKKMIERIEKVNKPRQLGNCDCEDYRVGSHETSQRDFLSNIPSTK